MPLFLEESGDPAAPTLVMLHGVGAAHEMWAPQLDALGRQYRVVLPDLPGYGRSDGPFTVDGAVEALHARLGAGPVHVCGLSAGAMVAVRWAARYPEDVANLIVSGVQVRAPQLLVRAQRLVMMLIPAGKFGDEGSGITKATVLRTVDELRRVDLRFDLAKVTAPTLVLCGGQDRFNLSAARTAAAGIRGAELRVIPDVGHLWNRDQPDLFNRTVADWLTARPAS